jgi:hypothetical protein
LLTKLEEERSALAEERWRREQAEKTAVDMQKERDRETAAATAMASVQVEEVQRLQETLQREKHDWEEEKRRLQEEALKKEQSLKAAVAQWEEEKRRLHEESERSLQQELSLRAAGWEAEKQKLVRPFQGIFFFCQFFS